MEWNVFRYDINSRQIEIVNIFNHGGFKQDFCKIAKKCKDKESFAEEVRRSLVYYFRSKCEWESIISSWPYNPDRDEFIKVDAYWQIRMNWSAFIEYVWEYRHEIKERR